MAKHKYYSQHGEDFLLWKIFEGKKQGFFVDVGAFDGIHLSNTYSFELEGWDGICIEPHPDYFRLCSESRPRSVTIQAACTASSADSIDFYGDELGLFSSMKGGEDDVRVNHYRQLGRDFTGFSKVTVRARDLNSILDGHVAAGRDIDLLSVDVEGAELDVLKGLDFSRYRPRIVIIETNTAEEREAVISFMVKGRGYLFVRQLGVNSIFACNQEDRERLQSTDVTCKLEPQIHPLGPEHTMKEFLVGKAICSRNVTVYMTSYNQKRYLEEAIESVLAQTLRPGQIIIVDDCSTDGSRELIARYADRFPTLITPIYHKRNLGIANSRISALSLVTGDYVTYLDGDDRFLPEKLEREAFLMSAHPGAGIVYSNYYYISPEGDRAGIWADNETLPAGDIFLQVFSRDFPKRNLFRNEMVDYRSWKPIGFHDRNLTIYEDYDMKIRLTKSLKALYCNEPLVEYRVHERGLSRAGIGQHLASLDYIYRKNIQLLDDVSPSGRERARSSFREWLGSVSLKGASQVRKDYEESSSPNEFYAAQTKGSMKRGANLIFVISQPRAGSTLLQRILAGHPDIHTTAEPWIMLHPLHALKREGIAADYDAAHAREALDDFLSLMPDGEETYYEALRKMGTSLYGSALAASGKYFFLDKTPRYYRIVPELYRLFPEARFIFLLRNPLAVLSSVCKTWYNGRIGELAGSLHYRDLVEGPPYLMEGIHHLREDAIVVRYEDLVTEPEYSITHLCNRIGIPFYDWMLEYGAKEAPRGKFGDSVGIRKYRRPVRSSLHKWLNSLSDPEVYAYAEGYLSAIGTKTLSLMGYPELSLRKWMESFLCNRDGEEKYAAGDLEGARESFARALEIEPQYGQASNNMGVLCLHSGDHQGAMACFTRALRSDPDDRTIVMNCGNMLMHYDRIDDAISLYTAYLRRNPVDTEIGKLLNSLAGRIGMQPVWGGA